MLKKLPEDEGPYELQLNRLFSSEPLASNPRNHCAPLLDVIQLPNDPPIMVHSQLRPYNDPLFHTFGEFVAFLGQICEVCHFFSPLFMLPCSIVQGIQFMHENHVAHRYVLLSRILFKFVTLFVRDCTSQNIMLDPSRMYPKSFHPMVIERARDYRGKAKGHTRTWCRPRYFLIDLGLSRQYDPVNGPPVEIPLRGGDKSAPEHRDMETPCNPFPTDVYYLGNLVREDYMQVCTSIHSQIKAFLSHNHQKYDGFEFIEPLIADMVQKDPKKRPTMDEVVNRFVEIKRGLSTWKLRSRMGRNNEIWPVTAWRAVSHWYRTVGYVISRKPALPDLSDYSNLTFACIALFSHRHISLPYVGSHTRSLNRYLVYLSWLKESLVVLLAFCLSLGRECNIQYTSIYPGNQFNLKWSIPPQLSQAV